MGATRHGLNPFRSEVFRGQTVWRGTVEVFDLTRHSKANRVDWSHADGPDDKDEKFVTVLELPPVESAQDAVKVAVSGEIKAARRK